MAFIQLPLLIAGSFLLVSLIVLAIIDFRTFRLPDLITLPLLVIGLLFNFFWEPNFAPANSA